MIIVTPEDSAKLSDAKRMTGSLRFDDQPPPSYDSQTNLSGSNEGVSSPSVTFKTRPTNYLMLSNEHNSFNGEFVIDPSIQIPNFLLPPLEDGETEADRKNLHLRCKYSSIHADIWLLPGGGQNGIGVGERTSRCTTINLDAGHGSINAQLKRLDGAAPFIMTANAPHGSVRITLPRSFQGLLSLSTRHGSVSLSDQLTSNATQLDQVEDTRRYFIGDFQSLADGEWNGDEVTISATHGQIRIKYLDEASQEQCKGGFFSRLFGR